MLKGVYKQIKSFGIDLKIFFLSFIGIPYFIKTFLRLFRQYKFNSNKEFPINKIFAFASDKYDSAGVAKGHYFHQDLLVAQKIFNANPLKHVDVGSRVDGFVAHVASFRKIEVFDIRPMQSKTNNIDFGVLNLMNEINPHFYSYCDSLSCLHTIEHLGLGRYGDPVNYYGHLQGIENLHKILKNHGVLYLSTPIGKQRIEFNAHRVFSVDYLLNIFKDKFEVLDFHYVDDSGDLYQGMLTNENCRTSFNCSYGCGIFTLKKLEN